MTEARDRSEGLAALLGLAILLVLAGGRVAHCEERLNLSRPAAASSSIAWESSYSVGVPNDDARAYLCAVGPFDAYTARHVVEFLGEETMEWRHGVTRGRVVVTERFGKRDLVRLRSSEPFPVYSPVAYAAPTIDSAVWTVNRLLFDDRRPVHFRAQVWGMDEDDQLAVYGPVMQGGSGGCAWADDGTVVGIHVAYMEWNVKEPKRAPLGYGAHEPLWGDWRKKR